MNEQYNFMHFINFIQKDAYLEGISMRFVINKYDITVDKGMRE